MPGTSPQAPGLKQAGPGRHRAMDDNKEPATQGPQDPKQEHPPQEAHGGSMAPDLVDDTGHAKPQDDEK